MDSEYFKVPMWQETTKGRWQVTLPPSFGTMHGNILFFRAKNQDEAQAQLDARMEALAKM